MLFLVRYNITGKYDQQEVAEQLVRKRLSEPDEEGWITVARKTPRTQLVGCYMYWYLQTSTAHYNATATSPFGTEKEKTKGATKFLPVSATRNPERSHC